MAGSDQMLSHHGGGDAGFEGGLETEGGGDEAGRIWEKKYIFVKGMIPGFVSEDFGQKVS
jgi:gamma-tubulin complex component 3